MKKDTKDLKKINITKESLDMVNHIIKNMDGKSFHNHYHILFDICNDLEKNNITYLEIGAYCGGSASLVSTNKNVTKVYSIDIGNPISKETPIKNVNRFKHDNCYYEYIQGDSMSNNVIDLVKSKIEKVDILFIDGDHTYNAVINDFNNYKDLVNEGGFIVFDDYNDKKHSPQVFPAVNDIVKTLDTDEYEIIGSLVYDLLKMTNIPHFSESNEFILRKKYLNE